MSKELTSSIEQLNSSVRNYIKIKLDLIKLTVLEKAAKTISIVYVLLVVMFFFQLIIATGVAAFAVWYGQEYSVANASVTLTDNKYDEGLLIAGGGLILITLLLVVVGKKLLSNIIIRVLSAAMFKDEKKTD